MACQFRCNIAECNKSLLDNSLVWITCCGHIFCDECGHVVLPCVSVACPICSHYLRSPFDIMKTELNPPPHFKKMVLLGLSPDDCLQAALSGVHFWHHQIERNVANAATSSCSNGHELGLVAQWEKHYQLTVAEMNQEINALREECHKVKQELIEARQNTTTMEPQRRASEDSIEEVDHYWNQPFPSRTSEASVTSVSSQHYRSTKPTQSTGRQFLGKY